MDKINKFLRAIRSIFYVVEGFFVRLFKKYRFFGMGWFIRRNGSFAIIALIAVFVSFSNISAKSENDAFLVGYWQDEKNKAIYSASEEDELFLDATSLTVLAPVSLEEDKKEGEEVYQMDVQILAGDNEELLGESTSIQRRVGSGDVDNEGDVRTYIVKDGDTVSHIAKNFGVSVNTILWANEVDDVTEVRPGTTLFILPTSGVKHKVKKNDTIDKIAKKYEVDDVKQIIEFNGLPANGEIEEGQELIIPGGEREEPSALFIRREYTQTGGSTNLGSSIAKNDVKKRRAGNHFPYGYCTYYVAQKWPVTWRGNAGAWLYNAKAQGYKTGKKPKAGSIVVTTEDAYYGHVAYVEDVTSKTITVSEMNYKGWGVKNFRTLSRNSGVIRGYIYR